MTPKLESLPAEVQEVIKTAYDVACVAIHSDYYKHVGYDLRDKIKALWPEFGEGKVVVRETD